MLDVEKNKDREMDAAIAEEVLGWRNVHMGKVWWCEGEASPLQPGEEEFHREKLGHSAEKWSECLAAYKDDYVGTPPKYVTDNLERIPDFTTIFADVEEVLMLLAQQVNVQLDNVGFVVKDGQVETRWRMLMGWGDDPVSVNTEDVLPARAIARAALWAMRAIKEQG